MKPLETSVEKVLRDAIQSEVETRVFLQKLAERAGSPDVRTRILQLADVELVHRAKLERKYRETVGQQPPDPAPVHLQIPDEVADLNMPRALKLALERERESESYYRFMAERAEPGSELAMLFMELAEVEWRHKTDLQTEYDSVAEPDRFLLDM